MPPPKPPQTATNSHTSIPDAVIARLIAVCPAKHLQHLQNLVDSDTDLTTLQQTLIDWIVETTTQNMENNNKKQEYILLLSYHWLPPLPKWTRPKVQLYPKTYPSSQEQQSHPLHTPP
jgi:hypothetical protein